MIIDFTPPPGRRDGGEGRIALVLSHHTSLTMDHTAGDGSPEATEGRGGAAAAPVIYMHFSIAACALLVGLFLVIYTTYCGMSAPPRRLYLPV